MRIAVVIASRNAARTLPDTLRSVYSQKRKPDEIWVVDDGSTDNTHFVLAHFDGMVPRIQYRYLSESCGPGAARNSVFGGISSDWVLPLDADDRLLSDALTCFEAFERSNSADMVYGDIIEVRNAKRTRVRYPDIPSGYGGIQMILTRPRIPFKHSACLFRKDILEKLGGYDSNLRLKVDVDLVVRILAASGKVEALHEPLLEHWVHQGQMSKRRWVGIRAYSSIVSKLERDRFQKVYWMLLRVIFELGKAICGR